MKFFKSYVGLLIMLIMLSISLGSIYGFSCLHRWLNWKMYYEDKVKEEIQKYHEQQEKNATN